MKKRIIAVMIGGKDWIIIEVAIKDIPQSMTVDHKKNDISYNSQFIL